jgi:GTP pyrophosphokinase
VVPSPGARRQRRRRPRHAREGTEEARPRRLLEEVHRHFPRYVKLDDFLAAIGYGAVTLQSISSRLVEETEQPVITTIAPGPARPATGLEVEGVGDLLINLARCCKPVPGDDIIGYITRGKGITVHRTDCPNIRHEPEKERLIAINWGAHGQELFPVTVRIEAWDRVGLLRDVSTVIADDKVNMTSVLVTAHADRTVTLLVTLMVSSVGQLSRVLSRIENVRDIYNVRRDAPLTTPIPQPSTAPAG